MRRELCSAERFREAAICFGLGSVNTPRRKSSASLSLVTRCDQRLGELLFVFTEGLRDSACRAVAGFFLPFRAEVLREREAFLVAAMLNSLWLRRKPLAGQSGSKRNRGPSTCVVAPAGVIDHEVVIARMRTRRGHFRIGPM